ncbi:hypothetical protein DFJ74DRAFT_683887 [Hyaloraphidium curvatum]|nr:hypothetical protein DFJ74DRAFT_683887 [Hyaloraphidium curvatum]
MSFLFSAVARDPGRNILVDEASPFNRSAGIDRYVPPDVPDAPACFAHSVWGLYPTMRHHNQYFPSDFVAYRNAMLVEHYRGLVFGEGPFPAEPFPDGRAVLHPSLRRPFRPLPGPPPSLPSGTVFEPPPGSPLSPPFRYPCHPSLIPLTLLLRNPLNPDRNLTNPHDALRWISELNPALEQRYGARVVPALASFDPPFPPDRQLLTAFRSRIFAGVHGAGLSWGLFLPPGSVLLEITVPWMMRHQLPGWEFGKPVEGFSGNGSEGMWFAQFAAAVGAAHYRTRMYAGAGGSVTLERADWEEAVDKAVEYVVRESKGTCSLDR